MKIQGGGMASFAPSDDVLKNNQLMLQITFAKMITQVRLYSQSTIWSFSSSHLLKAKDMEAS